jgi:hypothetical protein
MYYTLNTTIGTEIVVNGTTLVVGNEYNSKMKAPKDVDYILAFTDTKTVDSAGKKLWRFDGSADLDYSAFCLSSIDAIMSADFELNEENFADVLMDKLDPLFKLAWKTARIDIQAKIRPSKDSKKAIRDAERNTAIADIEARFAAGDIDAAEFGKLAIELTKQYS